MLWSSALQSLELCSTRPRALLRVVSSSAPLCSASCGALLHMASNSALHGLKICSMWLKARPHMLRGFACFRWSRALLRLAWSFPSHSLELCSTSPRGLLHIASSSAAHGLELWPTWSRAFPPPRMVLRGLVNGFRGRVSAKSSLIRSRERDLWSGCKGIRAGGTGGGGEGAAGGRAPVKCNISVRFCRYSKAFDPLMPFNAL